MPVAPKSPHVTDLLAIAVVGVGAALGGMMRLLVTTLVVARAGAAAAPIATFGINVVGSLAIGIVVGAVETRAGLSPLWRLFFATGILGGFTTFSTFSLDALALGASGALAASAYVGASVLVGIALAAAGLTIGRSL